MSETHNIGRPLAGATGWVITDGKAGMDVQAMADLLTFIEELK